MSQQINKDTVEDKKAALETPEATSSSEIKVKEPASKSAHKTKTIKKKSFSERWKTNRFWLVRGSYYVLNTVWMMVMAIGGFIAWLISLLFL